jgi:hypothetical protein
MWGRKAGVREGAHRVNTWTGTCCTCTSCTSWICTGCTSWIATCENHRLSCTPCAWKPISTAPGYDWRCNARDLDVPVSPLCRLGASTTPHHSQRFMTRKHIYQLSLCRLAEKIRYSDGPHHRASSHTNVAFMCVKCTGASYSIQGMHISC